MYTQKEGVLLHEGLKFERRQFAVGQRHTQYTGMYTYIHITAERGCTTSRYLQIWVPSLCFKRARAHIHTYIYIYTYIHKKRVYPFIRSRNLSAVNSPLGPKCRPVVSHVCVRLVTRAKELCHPYGCVLSHNTRICLLYRPCASYHAHD